MWWWCLCFASASLSLQLRCSQQPNRQLPCHCLSKMHSLNVPTGDLVHTYICWPGRFSSTGLCPGSGLTACKGLCAPSCPVSLRHRSVHLGFSVHGFSHIGSMLSAVAEAGLEKRLALQLHPSSSPTIGGCSSVEGSLIL